MRTKYSRLVTAAFIGLILGSIYGTITLIPKYICETKTNESNCDNITRTANTPQIFLMGLLVKNSDDLLMQNWPSLILLNGILGEIIASMIVFITKRKEGPLETVTKSRALIKRY